MRKLPTLVAMLVFVLAASTPALAQSMGDPANNPPLPDNGTAEKLPPDPNNNPPPDNTDINVPPPDPGNNPPPPDNQGGDKPPPGNGGNPPPPDTSFPRPRPGPDNSSTVFVCGGSAAVAEAGPAISVIEDCDPADEPLRRADEPVLADVPREAGSSGSRSFRGFSETLGGGGSTGMPRAAAAETQPPASEPEVDFAPVASRDTGIGSSPAADDDVSGNAAVRDDKPEPARETEPGPLPDTGGVPLFALGVVALMAGGLLLRRIAR